MQGYVVATWSSDKIMCCSHSRDMKQGVYWGYLAATKSQYIHTQENVVGKWPRDMSQQHIPLLCANNFWLMQHEFLQHFVPASCCRKGDVWLQHVSGPCPRYIFLYVYIVFFGCCYMSLIHILLLHVGMSLRLVPTRAETFRDVYPQIRELTALV